jgi:hypothetical protein
VDDDQRLLPSEIKARFLSIHFVFEINTLIYLRELATTANPFPLRAAKELKQGQQVGYKNLK